MLGEATLDVSGTFLGEAIRLLILFAAQHQLVIQARYFSINDQTPFQSPHGPVSRNCAMRSRNTLLGSSQGAMARQTSKPSRVTCGTGESRLCTRVPPKSGSHLLRRWREMDSNHRSPPYGELGWRAVSRDIRRGTRHGVGLCG